MSPRAIFVDLDGTLLNRSHRISAFTSSILQRIQKERPDVALVVATGRPYPDVFRTMRLCGLAPDYIITSNGARVHDRELKPVLLHDIPPRIVDRLYKINVEMENGNADPSTIRTVATNMYRNDEWVTNHLIENLGHSYSEEFQPRLVHGLHDVKDPDSTFRGVHEVFFYGPHDNLLPIERILQSNFKDDISFSFSLNHIIDVVPHGIDKGSAVCEVCELLGVQVKDAVAFGDGMNDLPMLQAVGRGFVMANAMDRLRAAMPDGVVVASNEDDGVAKKLVELLDLK